MTAAPHWINASDFASIQDAVDRLSATGGTVYIPKGTYDKNSVPAYEGGLLLPNQSKPVHLVGDGPGLTILKANSTDTVADMLQVYCPYATVTGLTLDGTNQPAGGRGLVLVPSVNPSTQLVIPGVAIADCHIMGTASWGIYVRGVVAGSINAISIWTELNSVRVTGNRADGGIYIGPQNTTIMFANSSVVAFKGPAVKCEGAASISLRNCTLEDSLNADATTPYIQFLSTFSSEIDNCWFEHHTTHLGTGHFIELGSSTAFCGSITIDRCRFVHQLNNVARIVRIQGSATRNVVIIGPQVTLPGSTSSSTNDIDIASGAEAYVLGGSIGTPTAFLPLQIADVSTNKTSLLATHRLRIPRLTTTERDALANILNGDVIANSTLNALQVYESGWKTIAAGTRTRQIDVGPADMVASTGAPTRGITGTAPDAYDRWSLTGGADRVVLFTTFIPLDWDSGSITVKAEYAAIAGAGDASGFMADFGYLAIGDGDNPTAAGGSLGPTNLPTTSPINSNVHIVSLGSFSTGLAAGKLLRCYFKRDNAAEVANGGANLQTLGLLGMRMEYVAGV